MSPPALASAVQDRPRDELRSRRESQPARPHGVQFYDSDDYLIEVVGAYIADGLAQGDPVLVIATEEHRRGFERWLGAAGASAAAPGQLVMLDARRTLATFMVEGMPDWSLFRSQVGGAVEQVVARAGGRPLRAYGEMVNLLWRDGQAQAALRLEEHWNRLGRELPFNLLCAYSMDNFAASGDGVGLEQVCLTHSHVDPAESFDRFADRDDLHRQVAQLQQRARALETELAHRKQLEADLRRQNETLDRTVRFSEMFVGILGHDLRNPLSAVVTAAALLLRRFQADEVARPAQRILNSAGRMSRMIDQLLDFTRIRLGQGLPLRRQRLDLRALCEATRDEVEVAGAGGCVRLDCEGDVGGHWDGDRLGQLISNLLGNALTHGTPGQPVSVRLDGSRPDEIRMEIHNGGEIPVELQPTLFEPFKRQEDLKQSASRGLGLGLYISNQIAEAHGGSIEFSSSREEGTRFLVRLPRGAAVAAA